MSKTKHKKNRQLQISETELEVYEVLRASGDLEIEIITRKVPSAVSALTIEDAVKGLQKKRLIVAGKDGKFRISLSSGLVIGRLEVKKQGYGFLIGSGEDFYMPSKQMHGAMNKDVILADLEARRGSKGRRTVATRQVLRRAHHQIIGRFEYHGNIGVIIPCDRRLTVTIEIIRSKMGKAKTGEIVVVEIEEYPEEYGAMPRGRVTEILGDEWDPRIEIEIILRQHGLSPTFPDEVEAAAQMIGETVDSSELPGRKDYRDVLTVTIDGKDAKDFDDAVSIEKLDSGSWKLMVHIADVSHYVGPGSPIWDEAEHRATSTYLVDRVIPMLPERLSNGICSLNPDVDRLCLTAEMTIDPKGRVADSAIHAGVIKSDARLTYDAVDAFLGGGSLTDHQAVVLGGHVDKGELARLEDLVTQMADVAKVLSGMRMRRGSLNFESSEAKVVLDSEGVAEAIDIRSRTLATGLIEEAMLLANETVAGTMKRRKLPMIYRIHEPPDQEILQHIYAIVEALGFPGTLPKDFESDVDSGLLQDIIDFAHDRPERLLLNTLLLRSMKQARYSATHLGHFGLASNMYTHFTSPIRRFPDLLVHHLVKREIGVKMPSFEDEKIRLAAFAEHSSVREREAEAAERESVEVKVCEYMQRHLGEEFTGIISGVAQWGFWVELENTAEGLVHVSSLTDDHYVCEPEMYRLLGSRKGNIYKLGQQVRVKLEKVKVGERQMDFVIAKEQSG